MITAISHAATWRRKTSAAVAARQRRQHIVQAARSLDFLYRASQFDAESAKFAQKRGWKFHWRPAGSNLMGRFELSVQRSRFCIAHRTDDQVSAES